MIWKSNLTWSTICVYSRCIFSGYFFDEFGAINVFTAVSINWLIHLANMVIALTVHDRKQMKWRMKKSTEERDGKWYVALWKRGTKKKNCLWIVQKKKRKRNWIFCYFFGWKISIFYFRFHSVSSYIKHRHTVIDTIKFLLFVLTSLKWNWNSLRFRNNLETSGDAELLRFEEKKKIAINVNSTHTHTQSTSYFSQFFFFCSLEYTLVGSFSMVRNG